MALQSSFIFLHWNLNLLLTLKDCRTFLRDSVGTPTKCRNLVSGWPDYVGITDASGNGAGGVILGERKGVPPTMFWNQWPSCITLSIIAASNHDCTITNSDLEMAGLLLLWLVMEAVCPTLANAHVALFSENTPTVHWVQCLASKHSRISMQLV